MAPTEQVCTGLDSCSRTEDDMVPTEKVCTGLDCCTRTEDDIPLLRLGVVCVRGALKMDGEGETV